MITRPETPPAKGQETAQWVLDAIENNPEQHDQSAWTDLCGTTRCVAGWAVFAHYENITAIYEEHSGWTDAGADLLGIDRADARDLFSAPDSQAVEALRYVADGKEIDWEKVYDG